MHPTICQIGPVAIHSFGVMVALATIICSVLMVRDAKKLNIRSEHIFDLVFWILISGLIGARLFFIFLNFGMFINDPVQMIMVQQGGLAWQGGFLFAMVTTVIFIKRRGWSLWRMADLIAPYLALGHAIGRVGCFLNGCCYGKEVAWGIYFPVHKAHLHPTQLYEMALLIGLFVLLKLLQKVYQKIPGRIFAFYVLLASMIRFGVEFFRADHQPLWLDLSVFQYVSILIFLIGLVLFVKLRVMNND